MFSKYILYYELFSLILYVFYINYCAGVCNNAKQSIKSLTNLMFLLYFHTNAIYIYFYYTNIVNFRIYRLVFLLSV